MKIQYNKNSVFGPYKYYLLQIKHALKASRLSHPPTQMQNHDIMPPKTLYLYLYYIILYILCNIFLHY